MRGAISLKLFLTLAALILLPALSYGQAGSFDAVFAGGSPLNIQMGSLTPLEEQVVLANGNIVLLSYRTVDGRNVNRLTGITAAGEIDTSFGNGGFVDFAWSDVVSGDRAMSIGIQNVNGQELIVVSGSWAKANGRKTPTRLLRIERFMPNGEQDTTFGSQGTASFANAGFGYRILVQPDGKIVTYSDQGTMARVDSDGGSLDGSFGSAGVVNVGRPGGHIAIDAAGLIYVTGRSGSGKGKGSTTYPSVIRYTPAGSVDTTFGSSGNALVPFSTASVNGIVIDREGNIVLGGTDTAGGTRDIAAYRLTNAGAMDAGFNGNGRSIFPDFAGMGEITVGVAVQQNGKVVVTGRASYDTAVEPHRFAAVRFNADGSIDSDFGDSGAATWSLLQDNVLINVTPRCENEDCTAESLIVSGISGPYLVAAKLVGN